MPPLRLFGRSWHVSSDDLAVPGIIGMLFHGTWSVIIIAQFASVGLPNDCPQHALATASIVWLFASFLLTTVLQVWVAYISLQGAMLEEHKRAHMPLVLYCLLAAYCLETAALIMTTVVYFGVLDSAPSCYTPEELARTGISDLARNRWFLTTTWVALGVVGGLLVLLYNLYPDRNLDAWVGRVNCLSYVFCCWRSLRATKGDQAGEDPSSSVATPTVLRLAKVFADIFYPLEFSFTDIVAALTLVGITHQSRAHGTGSSSHNHAVIAAAAAGLLNVNKPSAIAATNGSAAVSADSDSIIAADNIVDNGAAVTNGNSKQLLPGSSPVRTGLQAGSMATPVAAQDSLGLLHQQRQLLEQLLLHRQAEMQQQKRPVMQAVGLGHQSAAAASASIGVVQPDKDNTQLSRQQPMRHVQQHAYNSSGGRNNSSLWEQAVWQASALGVAPGYGASQGRGRRGSSPQLHSAARGERQSSHNNSASRACIWTGGDEVHYSGSNGRPAANADGAKHQAPNNVQQQNGLTGAGSAPALTDKEPAIDNGSVAADAATKANGKHAEIAACADAPPSIRGSSSSIAGAKHMHFIPAIRGTTATGGNKEGAAAQDDPEVPLELLEEALHWHGYANAIYGWPMFMWSHRYRCLRCCRLCCGRCYWCVQGGVTRIKRTSSTPSFGADTEATAVAATGQASNSGWGSVPVAEGIEAARQPYSACGPKHVATPAVIQAAGSTDSNVPGSKGNTSTGWDLEEGRGGSVTAEADLDKVSVHIPALARIDADARGTDVGGCCCYCFESNWGPTYVPKMAPLTASQRLTREAIVQTAKIPEAALLYVNYHNLVEGLLPYSVAVDEGRRCVVVAVRGSLSVEDCVTDVLYDPAPLDEDWLVNPAAQGLPAVTGHDGRMPESCMRPQPIAAATGHDTPPLSNGSQTLDAATPISTQQPAINGGSLSAQAQTRCQQPASSSTQQPSYRRASPFQCAQAASLAATPTNGPSTMPARSGSISTRSSMPAGQRQTSSEERTTTADRALGAARATHNNASLTSWAADAVAAAASSGKQQQQQQRRSKKASRSNCMQPLRASQSVGGHPTLAQVALEPLAGSQQEPQHQCQQSQSHGKLWHHRQQGPESIHTVLQGSGPTDEQLREGAIAMSPSITAAVHPAQSDASQLVAAAAESQPSTAVSAEPDDAAVGIEQQLPTPFLQQQTSTPEPLSARSSASATEAEYSTGSYPTPAVQKPSSTGSQQEGAKASTSRSTLREQALAATAHAALHVGVSATQTALAAAAESKAAAWQAVAAEDTPDTGAAGDQWFAHEGILKCARAIRGDLQRLGLLDQLLLGTSSNGRKHSSSRSTVQWHTNGAHGAQQQSSPKATVQGPGVVAANAAATAAVAAGGPVRDRQLPDCRGWTLMLVGHSLGGGVAALLALHYRAVYPSVRSWCFAPPGGLMSPAAAASLKDICYSVINGKDMVPRMSLWTIERLRDEMMLCALRCKVPKLKLLLGAFFGLQWTEQDVLRPLQEMTAAQIARYRAYRRTIEEERSLDPLRVRIAREFIPPGEIIWLERYKVVKPWLRLQSTKPLPAAAADTRAPSDAAVGGAAMAGRSPAATTWVAETGSDKPCCVDMPDSKQPAVDAEQQGKALPAEVPAAASSTWGSIDTSEAVIISSDACRGRKAAGAGPTLHVVSAPLAAVLANAPAIVVPQRTVIRLRPHFTDGLSLTVGGMVVSRNMFADHVPDAQLAQLKRLVRWMQRQRARQLLQAATDKAPQQQLIPQRQHAV